MQSRLKAVRGRVSNPENLGGPGSVINTTEDSLFFPHAEAVEMPNATFYSAPYNLCLRKCVLAVW